MPKKSTKSKSKRMTLKQKYKVIRKVKDHHRKKRKEMKKLGLKPKEPKDPGIPAQWPFKEDLLKELAWKKQQILSEEKQKKEDKKRRREERNANVEMEDANDDGNLQELAQQARKRQADFDTRKRARLGQEEDGDKDRTRKAFYREFKAVAERADVVIQVLDARDPLGCRCPDIERYIRSLNPNKRVILLLNKIDLVPRDVAEKWLRYFREELPCVAFKCSTQQQASNMGQRPLPSAKSASDGLQGSGCLGADTLLQLLKNYTRNQGLKTAIVVGVVGLPNVGKSSLINSLKRARVAQVGNTPGVTKNVQEVQLEKNIKLLDSPGVVFSSSEGDAAAMLRNCVKVENLADPVAPVAEILKRVPAKTLMVQYKIAAFKDVDQFLQLVAGVRGKLKKGGTPDMAAAARLVLQDWNNGVIPFYTLPPKRDQGGFDSAEVVAQWAGEFNADEVFANEASAVIAHLPAADEHEREWVHVESGAQAHIDLAAMEHDQTAASEEAADMEEDNAAAAALAKRQAASQQAILYGEPGQFNPNQARAEKKRLKKLKQQMPEHEDADEAFDFDEANAELGHQEASADEDADGEEEAEEDDGSSGEESADEEDEMVA